MNAKLSLLNRRLVIEANGADPKAIFRELGLMAEIFEADTACGACRSLEIRPNCRTVDGYDYYALKCSACGAELSFGQRKDGGLFARRKAESGALLDDRGWLRFNPARAIEPAAPAAPAAPPRTARPAARPNGREDRNRPAGAVR